MPPKTNVVQLEPLQGWDDFPWSVVDLSVGETLPTFPVIEVLFAVLTLMSLLYTRSFPSGSAERQWHILLFLCSCIGGVANDFFFMWLPIVDNFWHAQGTIMLGPRFPLYILGVYHCVAYYPNALCRRLGIRDDVSHAAVTALLTAAFYMPFDCVGVEFLWWTWHDTDHNCRVRLFGVPVASTAWILHFYFVFALILRRIGPRHGHGVSLLGGARVIAGLCIAAVPLMMVSMSMLACALRLSLPPPPAIDTTALLCSVACLVAYAFASLGSPRHTTLAPYGGSALMAVALVVHFSTLAGIAALGEPRSHISTGVHQTYGQCSIEEQDYTGAMRRRYLCAETLDEPFAFDCGHLHFAPAEFSAWYSICGTPHAEGWTQGALALAGGGAFFSAAVLVAGEKWEKGCHHAEE